MNCKLSHPEQLGTIYTVTRKMMVCNEKEWRKNKTVDKSGVSA